MEQALPWDPSCDRGLAALEECNDNINSSASTPFVSAPCSPRSSTSDTDTAAFYSSNTPTRPVRATLDIRTSSTTGVAFACYTNGDSTVINCEYEAEELVSFPAVGSDDFDFNARFSDADPHWSPAPMSSADELFFNGQIRPLWFNSEESEHTADKPRLWDPGSRFDFRSSVIYTPCSAPQSPRTTKDKNLVQRFVDYDYNKPSDEGILCGMKQNRKQVPIAIGKVEKLKANELKLNTNVKKILSQDMVKVEEACRGRSGIKEGGAHRRTRSLSPSRVFHMDDEMPRQSFETVQSFHSARTCVQVEKEEEEEERKAKKVQQWTLRDLLHAISDDTKSSSSNKKQEKAPGRRQKKASLMHYGEKMKERNGLCLSPIKPSPKRHSDEMKGPASQSRSPHPHSQQQLRWSPHELHYASQRAQSEQMRRKTFLPYRHGLLGCLGCSSKSYRRSVAGIQTFHSKP